MNQYLKQFTRQLAAWTEEIIERGRTPFRRVDTQLPINSDNREITIPLVFWINRQSMMAGGLILVPENDLDSELEQGRAGCLALGLRHFVTWEREQVRIWQVKGGDIAEHQAFQLSDPDHPETFRFVLEDLLDALKLTAVLGAIPPQELSPSYFTNLYRITLQQTQPPLTRAFRSYRSANEQIPYTDIDTCAREENRRTLLQILALLHEGKMPPAMLPEKLERALELSLPQLPERLYHALSQKRIDPAPEMPQESAVAFHHFILRLRQLSWGQHNGSAELSLRELAKAWFPEFSHQAKANTNMIYPRAPQSETGTGLILSYIPSLLALTAMFQQQTTDELTAGLLIFGNLFKLGPESLGSTPTRARLYNSRLVTVQERSEFTAQLRHSWPHRRFKIRTGQPLWNWEFVHLLGLTKPGQELICEIPLNALQRPANGLIWTLFSEHFCIREILPLKANLQISLVREKQAQTPITVLRTGHSRIIPTAEIQTEQLRNQILLALELPDAIYALLGKELFWPDEITGKASPTDPEYKSYRESRLHRLLENTLRAECLYGTDDLIFEGSGANCIPLPDPQRLKQLAGNEKVRRLQGKVESFDQLLAELFACPELTDLELPETELREHRENARGKTQKELKEELLHQANVFGIPNFPEQYLYFLEHPEMQYFKLSPPLVVVSRIMGQFVLEDAEGARIEGFGEELEQALLFAAMAGKTEIDLPRDREQLNMILEHYRKDLKTLFQQLSNLCYSQLANSDAAQKLMNKTWKKLQLPELTWVKS